MPKPPASREARADNLLGRMPHVPDAVRQRFRAAMIAQDPVKRGAPKHLEAFFAHLETVGRPLPAVRPEDFRAVATSRTSFYTLIWALGTFAPEVPLAAARQVQQEWDRWLNTRYPKPRKPRRSPAVTAPPDAWPAEWRAALPCLDRTVRSDGRTLRPLASKTRASVVQAVGMLVRAQDWARDRGVEPSGALDQAAAEILIQYMTHARRTCARTIADYLERVRMFGRRGGLLDAVSQEDIGLLIGDLRAEAAQAEPRKRAQVARFRRRFSLGAMMARAVALIAEAEALPDYSARAERKRRAAVVLALLVNTADRQGDLSRHRIGVELERSPEGLWQIGFRQSKTRRRKELGGLWPVTSDIIDAHILAGRPSWCLQDRLGELDGHNLLSLPNGGFHLYMPSRILREEFGVSGHLVRTLITDAIRAEEPDAAWAAQFMLGHSNRTMQETYRTDFREAAAVRSWQDLADGLQGSRSALALHDLLRCEIGRAPS